MNDHLCEKCGATKVFVGSLLMGRLECPECTDAETLAESIEIARLKAEELDQDDLVTITIVPPGGDCTITPLEEDVLLVDANIKRLNAGLAGMSALANEHYAPVHRGWTK